MNDSNEPIFFEGKTGWARQVDLNDLGDTSFLVPIESDLETLGFEKLGDFINSSLTSALNRAWVNRQQHMVVLLLIGYSKPASTLGVLAVFFDTLFTDGFGLTTTATPALKDRETTTRCRKVHLWTNTYNLYQEHKRSVEQLSNDHGATVPSGESLYAVIKSIDDETANYG